MPTHQVSSRVHPACAQGQFGAGARFGGGLASPLCGWAAVGHPSAVRRSTATVRLQLRDKHGVVLEDSFSVSFHLHFAKLLKWLTAGPLVACAAAVLSMQTRSLEAVLPSFRHSTE